MVEIDVEPAFFSSRNASAASAKKNNTAHTPAGDYNKVIGTSGKSSRKNASLGTMTLDKQ